MAFEIPPNIHPWCAPLAWMVGHWAGNGHGEYPGIDPFSYGQELIVQQDGRPFLHLMSRAWRTDGEGNLIAEAAQETGFIRPQEDRSLEIVLAHNTGIVEIWTGEIHPTQPRFEVTTDAVARTATARDYAGGTRLYGYVEGDLMYAFDMVTSEKELGPHIYARLARQ